MSEIIKAFAYDTKEKEMMMYNEEKLKSLNPKDITIIIKQPNYGHTLYSGEINNPELSNLDIALLCDSNLCFGARVTRGNRTFECRVHTD